MKNQKTILFCAVMALGMNLMWVGSVFGQSSNQSTVSVNRSGNLSFASIPSSFNFGIATIPSQRMANFSDPTVTAGSLPTNKKLTVQDTRGEGGFMVTISANSNFINENNDNLPISNIPPNDNLRIVTTPLFTGSAGTTANGIVYDSGFIGNQTVVAELNTTSNNFADGNTFLNVVNNVLDTAVPVDVFDGTLPVAQGRVGRLSTGVSAMLYIPAFQAPGQYVTTLTWTLSDSTTP